jgi:pyroglutamyl-peptidase
MSTCKVIFITGFGVFGGHEKVNASWEAVKLIPDRLTVKNEEYLVKKLEIPVVYDAVNDVVPQIWAENPVVSQFHSQNRNIN